MPNVFMVNPMGGYCQWVVVDSGNHLRCFLPQNTCPLNPLTDPSRACKKVNKEYLFHGDHGCSFDTYIKRYCLFCPLVIEGSFFIFEPNRTMMVSFL
jgi:hypothetical protein